MDFHLSFNNVTKEEAAFIFLGLGNALNTVTSGDAKLKEVASKYDAELAMIVDKYNVPSPAEQALSDKAEKETPDPTTVTKVANPKKTEEPVKEELDFDNASEQTTEQEENEKEVTKEDIQQHTQKLVKANASNKAQIIALLKTFKTVSISKLKPEDYEKFEDSLKSLDDVDLPF